MIHKKWKKHIKSWNAINERIITLDLEIFNISFMIVGVYAPNDDATLLVKEEFYTKLSEVILTLGNKKELILLGDFNARVGRKVNDQVVGQYGEDVLNDNGTRLIEICEQFSLKILNGFYPHKDIHKYTWTQSTKGLKSIIDYSIIGQTCHVKIMDVRVKRGLIVGPTITF